MKHLLFAILLLPYLCNAQFINTVAGNGSNVPINDGGPAVMGAVYFPEACAFDKHGNLYVAEFGVIRRISPAGIITTVAGNFSLTIAGGYGDGGPATDAALNHVQGLAIDTADNIIISDSYNFRIRKVNAITSIISTIAGNGTLGYSGDYGPATNANIGRPKGLCTDRFGNIYFADNGNNRIRKIDASGTMLPVAGNSMAGYTSDGGMADTTRINPPSSMCTDDTGNLYFMDVTRIRKINSLGIVQTIAGVGYAYADSGDGGPATAAQIYSYAIARDRVGNFFIGGGSRVRMINTAGIINTIAGCGIPGDVIDGVPATLATIHSAVSIVTDTCGNVYFCDAQANRVFRVSQGTHCWLTDVPEEVSRKNLEIYPNPARASLTIKAPEEIVSVSIINPLGSAIYAESANNNSYEMELDLSRIPAGIYYLRINQSYITKFVKE